MGKTRRRKGGDDDSKKTTKNLSDRTSEAIRKFSKSRFHEKAKNEGTTNTVEYNQKLKQFLKAEDLTEQEANKVITDYFIPGQRRSNPNILHSLLGGRKKTRRRRQKKGGDDDEFDDSLKTSRHINVMRERALAKFSEPFEDTPAFEQRLVQAFKAEGLSEAQAQQAKRAYMIQHSTPATAAQRMRAAMSRRSGGRGRKIKTKKRRSKKGGRKRKTKTRKAGMDRKEEVKSVLKEWKPVEGKGSLPDIPADKIATKVKETEDKEFQEWLREQEEEEYYARLEHEQKKYNAHVLGI